VDDEAAPIVAVDPHPVEPTPVSPLILV